MLGVGSLLIELSKTSSQKSPVIEGALGVEAQVAHDMTWPRWKCRVMADFYEIDNISHRRKEHPVRRG